MPNLKEIRLRVCILWQFFASVWKEEKEKRILKNEENERLFEGLYFKNGWRNLLQMWCVFSPDMPALSQRIWSCLVKRPRSYERTQNHTLFFVLIYSCCVCGFDMCFLGPHDTLQCVLMTLIDFQSIRNIRGHQYNFKHTSLAVSWVLKKGWMVGKT